MTVDQGVHAHELLAEPAPVTVLGIDETRRGRPEKFKQWRDLATRYDKLAVIFRGSAILRSIIMWLRSPIGDTP